MRWQVARASLAFYGFAISLAAQNPELSIEVKRYVKVEAPNVVLTHVRMIDGTGAVAVEDQNVVNVPVSTGVTVQDLRGYSVMPGIVGMHNHLYYQRRPNLKSDWSGEAPLLLPDDIFGATSLSGRRRDDDADHGNCGTLRRPEFEARYRGGQAPGAAH